MPDDAKFSEWFDKMGFCYIAKPLNDAARAALVQIGQDAAAALDSVAATAFLVAKEVLTGTGELSKILEGSRNGFTLTQTKIAQDGPAMAFQQRWSMP